LAGGGTGGHIYPNLAVAEEVRHIAPDTEFLYLGTSRLEEKVVPASGIPFARFPIRFSRRRMSRANLAYYAQAIPPIILGVPLVRSWSILSRFGPDAMISTGGYVGFFPMLVAVFTNVPLFIIEPNRRAGWVNIFFSRRAARVFVGFDATASEFGFETATRSFGIPVRSREGVDRARVLPSLGLRKERKTVLVVGGSQGSSFINDLVIGYLAAGSLGPIMRDVQIIHQTGETDLPRMQEVARKSSGRYAPLAYIDDLPSVLACSDAFVGRSGASTVGEVIAFGVPALFVPLAGSVEGHQAENAKDLSDAGAALTLRESDATAERFAESLSALLNYEKAAALRSRLKKLRKPSAQMIAEEVLAALRR
jgi:UDP-N-acetylglucosamine--N-acetylmuramyl-(pentapeptide) pyrophosphoryl-undecaprenol N-acetylglucosamine transferase